MATIFDYISESNCQRPIYTGSELGYLVTKKREEANMTLGEFALQYGIDERTLKRIENAEGTFTPKMYRVCAMILGLSLEDILEVEHDDAESACFRTETDCEAVNRTVEFANQLFNEIIMQRKIGIR